MKSKLFSRVLSVAAAAAMMATMATTGFAAAGVNTDVYVGDTSYTDEEYSAAIGSSFLVDAVIYYGSTNYSDNVGATATWAATIPTSLTITKLDATTDAEEIAAIGTDYTTATVAPSLGTTNVAYSAIDAGYVSVAKVAGTDGKQVKVTPKDAPVIADATVTPPVVADTFTEYVKNGTDYYKYLYTVTGTDVTLTADGSYSSYGTDDASMSISISDNRFVLGASDLTNKGYSTCKFNPASTNSALTIEDGVVTAIDLGTKTQITYNALQAIYNQEEAVAVVSGDITYTIDGLNMSSMGTYSDTSVMTLTLDAGRLSRTTRANIAEASKDYGADFAVAVADDPDDYEYYPLNLSDITIPDAVGSVTISFDPDDVYEGGDLADYAADGELYMYLYDDGEFTLFDTVDTTGRRDSDLTFEIEDGDQGLYILTTTKLEKGAASSSSSTPSSSSSTPASSSTAPSSDIPNTGDANVVAIAVMMAVIALGGAAVVAKKATK